MNKKVLIDIMNQQELREHPHCPPSTLAWLETAHLTAQLKAICSHYQFNVLSEGWQSSFLALERILLDLDGGDSAWIRASCHFEANQPLIFARVVVPRETFEAHAEDFLNLKQQPIGQTLLYNNPHVVRSDFTYCLDADPRYLSLFGAVKMNYLWIRASVFTWSNAPLLITEFFSTELPLHPEVQCIRERTSCC